LHICKSNTKLNNLYPSAECNDAATAPDVPVSRTLPIVFVLVTDPVGSGFVPNLARPGGRLTGFTAFEFSIGSKWLEALKEIAPAVKRVAFVYNPDTAPFAPLFWRPVMEAAARSFAVASMQMPVRGNVPGKRTNRHRTIWPILFLAQRSDIHCLRHLRHEQAGNWSSNRGGQIVQIVTVDHGRAERRARPPTETAPGGSIARNEPRIDISHLP
jgi:ABC transporter substrate binding protein